MRIIVTGGAGFIGSHLVRKLINTGHNVLNIDDLTYAANTEYLKTVENSEGYTFLKADICNTDKMIAAFTDFSPDAVLHLAAESHVDRSIASAHNFLQTNVNGTFSMLEAARLYWEQNNKSEQFRFVHVSTDEVYGSLQKEDAPFNENSQYLPNSPYSASKASSDHLARAWFRTYGLPCIITHCSNNFGPCQHDEKLIPTIIRNAVTGNPLPVYGSGENIRDWIYVEDHVDGLIAALEKGKVGEVYNFGGNHEISNIDLVKQICIYLDKIIPLPSQHSYEQQISFVEDRKGHDFRYAICNKKSDRDLGWAPAWEFDTALAETIGWYLEKHQSGKGCPK